VNIGFGALAVKLGLRPTDVAMLLETVSMKVGTVSVVLGGMHFFNLYVFARIRRRGQSPRDLGAAVAGQGGRRRGQSLFLSPKILRLHYPFARWYRRTQIGRHHLGAGEARAAAHDRTVPLHRDVGAHAADAAQLGHVHEAVICAWMSVHAKLAGRAAMPILDELAAPIRHAAHDRRV